MFKRETGRNLNYTWCVRYLRLVTVIQLPQTRNEPCKPVVRILLRLENCKWLHRVVGKYDWMKWIQMSRHPVGWLSSAKGEQDHRYHNQMGCAGPLGVSINRGTVTSLGNLWLTPWCWRLLRETSIVQTISKRELTYTNYHQSLKTEVPVIHNNATNLTLSLKKNGNKWESSVKSARGAFASGTKRLGKPQPWLANYRLEHKTTGRKPSLRTWIGRTLKNFFSSVA